MALAMLRRIGGVHVTDRASHFKSPHRRQSTRLSSPERSRVYSKPFTFKEAETKLAVDVYTNDAPSGEFRVALKDETLTPQPKEIKRNSDLSFNCDVCVAISFMAMAATSEINQLLS